MRVASMCGSLGPASTNQAALDDAVDHLVAAGHVVVPVEGLADVPASSRSSSSTPVRSSTHSVAVLSAGTTGGGFAIEQAVRTLTWQGALVVETLGIASPRTKTDADGRFVDAETLTAIRRGDRTRHRDRCPTGRAAGARGARRRALRHRARSDHNWLSRVRTGSSPSGCGC